MKLRYRIISSPCLHMQWNYTFFLSIIIHIISGNVIYAQKWYNIIHTGGVQIVGPRDITVTPAGAARGLYECGGIGPYYIGENYSHDPNAPVRPGRFTFDFSTPVKTVKVQIRALDQGEIITFYVNGAQHMLTHSDIFPFPTTCANDGGTVTDVLNGALYQPLPGSGRSAEINIVVPAGIHNLAVHANGTRNGSVFQLQAGDMEASNNRPCRGDTLKLYGSPETDSVTYSWTGPGGFSSTERNPVIPNPTSAHSGVYTFRILKNGRVYTDTTHVTVLPAPPRPVIEHNEPLCAGGPLNFSVKPNTPGVRYQWTGPAGFHDTTAAPIIPALLERHSGQYTVTVSAGTCSVMATTEIKVPRLIRQTLAQTICGADQYNFNGRILTEPGNYTDTLTSASGCDSVVILSLVRLPVPEVSILPQAGQDLCIGDSILLEAQGAPRYTWYDQNGIEIKSGKAVYIPLPELANTITLIGMAGNHCRDTASITIPTQGCCVLFAPNAFTPNGDGKNDRFGGSAQRPVRNYQMVIFNRWGQRIFYTQDIRERWDGSFDGLPAETGTYYYSMSAECLTGEQMQRQGDLTLIR